MERGRCSQRHHVNDGTEVRFTRYRAQALVTTEITLGDPARPAVEYPSNRIKDEVAKVFKTGLSGCFKHDGSPQRRMSISCVLRSAAIRGARLMAVLSSVGELFLRRHGRLPPERPCLVCRSGQDLHYHHSTGLSSLYLDLLQSRV